MTFNIDNPKKYLLFWYLSLLFFFLGLVLYFFYALYIYLSLLIYQILCFAASYLLYAYSTKHLRTTENSHLLQCVFLEYAFEKEKKPRTVQILQKRQFDYYSFASRFAFSADLSKDELRTIHSTATNFIKTTRLAPISKLLIRCFGRF